MKKLLTIVIAALGIAVLPAASPRPVLHFPANEGSGDILKNVGSAEGCDARIIGTDFQWDAARDGGKAIAFLNPPKCVTGKNSCAIVNLKGKMDFTKPFTAMFWVNLDPALLINSQYTIIGNVKSDYGPGWRIIYSYNAFRFIAGGGTAATIGSLSLNPGKTPHPKGAWHHLGAVYDGENVKLYLNGIESAAGALKLQSGHDTLTVGAYDAGYAYGFRGSLSDIKFFDCALTPEQMVAEAQGIRE